MNRALACAGAALICASCESRSPEPVESATEGPASAAVGTGWPVHGGTTNEQRFSPLAQINRDTIADLKPAWFVEFDTNRGQEATPIVVDGVLYTSTAWSKVYAVNAKTGERVSSWP